MADVVEIERTTPPVKTITLKLTKSEAYELVEYIEEYYKRYPYMGKADTNNLHKALKAGLNGKTSAQVASEAVKFTTAAQVRVPIRASFS